MWITELPSFVYFYLGALLLPLLPGKARNVLLLLIPLLSGVFLWQLPEGNHWQTTLLGFELTPFYTDRLSVLFGYVFHIAAFIAIVYALHVRDLLQQVASLLYAGSALGAVFSGDLLSLFVFWEMLAVTSVFLVFARRTERAYRAGMRYLTIQVVSGLLLLVGVILHAQVTGSLRFEWIGLEQEGPAAIAGWLIFIAFGIKCAFPLLHTWLTDAYPEATPTGTIFLSAFTTKVAVYALARGYAGTDLLIYIGALMTCFPIFYAVIENDLRRVLAYSLINQVGFMVVGIGIGTALALNGAVAHAFNDVIFKGLLFMSMGAVLHMTGKINGSELGGLYKSMPKTTILCLVGAASISAFPLFSGFVSKSMVMSAALANDHHIIWLMLLFASAGVFHHAGIKIPYFAFFAHDSGIRTTEPPTNMLIAMTIAAVLCVAIGAYPQMLYSLLPFELGYSPYDATHVLAQTQLLFFSALAFVWLNLRGMYPPELPSVNLDAEWLYRHLLPRLLQRIMRRFWAVDALLRQCLKRGLVLFGDHLHTYSGPQGILAKTWPTGRVVFWVAVILALFLVLSLF
ncbi:Na(+)/H(+) antiporter subunit D [Pseudomaricurvus alcaniphilus]|uniref:Na(+)/H(+) antiporter subunit D n=1 Tax=Pseudomaricurvus alcaniphilus TaxID=1166482 RepID=UPI001407834E|nr:Na(+)/H(+) antiporter subunit D [Pseudomaricurvus alcaniphilus]NHN36496.1 Na(+)/H(+) antiporter subunit D [Pseudomaricurvus alcaniphilus]